MTGSPRRVLFVCTGNICRSAMAEHLLRHWSEQRGLGLEVRSCGTAAESWYKVPDAVHRLLKAEGVPPVEHRPQLLTRDQLRWADLALVMTRGHLEYVVELYPEFTRKTELLLAKAGLGEKDVEDPMGQSDEVFARCLATIRGALQTLVDSGFRP